MSAINQGKPLLALDSGAEISKKVRGLSDALSGKSEQQQKKKGFFGLSLKLLQ
jgi:Flp pilus assembly CpaE family ATPase